MHLSENPAIFHLRYSNPSVANRYPHHAILKPPPFSPSSQTRAARASFNGDLPTIDLRRQTTNVKQSLIELSVSTGKNMSRSGIAAAASLAMENNTRAGDVDFSKKPAQLSVCAEIQNCYES